MGILKGGSTLRLTEEDLVYSEDPDVTVPPELAGCGWVPREQCQVRPGADELRTRALTDAEKTAARDRYGRAGEATMNLFTAQRGVIRVGKADVKKAPDKVAGYVAALAQQDPTALDLLARRIDAVTMGRDPADGYALARGLLGYPPFVAQEVRPDEGSEPKSG